MKRITLLLFIIGVSCINAQSIQKHLVYLSNEGSFGLYSKFGLDVNANYIYNEKYSFKAGYAYHLGKAKSTPNDYKSGVSSVFLFFLRPLDAMETFQIAAGRIFKLNDKGTVRANLALGIGYTISKQANNWVKVKNAYVANNYTWDYNRQKTISFIINPKIEIPNRFYGITFSPVIYINKYQTYFGIGLGSVTGMSGRK